MSATDDLEQVKAIADPDKRIQAAKDLLDELREAARGARKVLGRSAHEILIANPKMTRRELGERLHMSPSSITIHMRGIYGDTEPPRVDAT